MLKTRYNPSTTKKIILVVGMVIAIAVIIFSGGNRITSAIAEAQLKNFDQFVKEEMKREYQLDATFTYGAVEIEGMGDNAIITQPTLTLSDPKGSGMGEVVITTERAIIDNSREGGYAYEALFPEPIKVTEGALSSTMVFENAPLYLYGITNKNGVGTQLHKLVLDAGKVTLTDSENGQDVQTIHATYGGTPELRWEYGKDGSKQSHIAFGTLNVMGDGDKQIFSADGVKQISKRTPMGDDEKVAVTYDVSLEDASIFIAEQKRGPFNVTLQAEGTESLPLLDGTPVVNESYQIKEFVLSGDGFSVSANGEVEQRGDDALPFGRLDAKAEGINALREHVLNPAGYGAFNEGLKRITGGGPVEANQITFTIHRPKHGEVKIGNASLDELMYVMLTHAMLGEGQGGTNAVPPVLKETAPSIPAPVTSAPAPNPPLTQDGHSGDHAAPPVAE